MKTKADAKIEAARLAVDSEAKDFTEKATEIYKFLTDGIEMPNTEILVDPASLVSKYFCHCSDVTPEVNEKEEQKPAEA